MKTTRVSPRAKTLNDLLAKARRRAVILETTNGEQFVLASIEDRRSGGKRMSLAEVKAELGLD